MSQVFFVYNLRPTTKQGFGMKTRICSKCGLEKDIEEFPLRSSFTQRRQSYCKSCRSEMGKKWYQQNKEYQTVLSPILFDRQIWRSEGHQSAKYGCLLLENFA
jgi:threonyl-tRNA synthetase